MPSVPEQNDLPVPHMEGIMRVYDQYDCLRTIIIICSIIHNTQLDIDNYGIAGEVSIYFDPGPHRMER